MRAWRNTLMRFGLVAIPVSLAPAVAKASVSAHRYDADTLKRVRQAWVNDEGELVAETAMLYDRGEGLDPVAVELDPIEGEREIALAGFIATDAVDPLLYDQAYALNPGKGGEDGLGLVAAILRESHGLMILVGEARFTERPVSVAIRYSPTASGLVLHTLHPTARVRWAEMRKAAEAMRDPSAELLAQGELLTEALPSTFTPLDVDPREAALIEALADTMPEGRVLEAEVAPTAKAILDTLKADLEAKAKGKTKGEAKTKAGKTKAKAKA